MQNTLSVMLLLCTIAAPLSLHARARSETPAPKLKINEIAPLCRVCNKGLACGDNCYVKKFS